MIPFARNSKVGTYSLSHCSHFSMCLAKECDNSPSIGTGNSYQKHKSKACNMFTLRAHFFEELLKLQNTLLLKQVQLQALLHHKV